MRVFVLTTGRSGSVTFANACRHITNFTSAHESRFDLVDGRLDYPEQHIEVDNRLAWFLGPLALRFPDAFYVHLIRDPEAVARSYARRLIDLWGVRDRLREAQVRARRKTFLAHLPGAFGHGILYRTTPYDEEEALAMSRLMVSTINSNIDVHLQRRDHVVIDIEEPAGPFAELWTRIGAEGQLDAALRALTVRENAIWQPWQDA